MRLVKGLPKHGQDPGTSSRACLQKAGSSAKGGRTDSSVTFRVTWGPMQEGSVLNSKGLLVLAPVHTQTCVRGQVLYWGWGKQVSVLMSLSDPDAAPWVMFLPATWSPGCLVCANLKHLTLQLHGEWPLPGETKLSPPSVAVIAYTQDRMWICDTHIARVKHLPCLCSGVVRKLDCYHHIQRQNWQHLHESKTHSPSDLAASSRGFTSCTAGWRYKVITAL